MLTYAMTALAANKQARLAGQRATFGRVEVDAQRHQRGAVAGDRLARRAGVVRRRRYRAGGGRRAAGDRAGRARRDGGDGERRVGVGAVGFDLDLAARTRRDAATGRRSRPRPATTPESSQPQGSRPRCSSSATPPASTTRRPSRRDGRLPRRRHRPRRHAREAARDDARRTSSSGPGSTAPSHDDVLVEIDDGRFAAVDPGGEPAIGVERLRGLTLPGSRELPTATPSTARCAAAPSAGEGRSGPGATRCTPSPGGSTPTATSCSPGDVPRDGRGGDHHGGGVPLPAPPARRHAVRRPQRDGSGADRGRPRAPGSGSRCSTPATSAAASVPNPRGCSAATPTERRSGGPSAWPPSGTTRRRRHPLGARGARRPARHGRRGGPGPAAARAPLRAVAENDDCIAAYGATPTQLLADRGVLGPLTTAVHATHLTDDDIGHLGGTRTFACFCPTTERDLGDGIGPGTALRDAGSRLTLGSDSHAVIDLFEEMRAARARRAPRHPAPRPLAHRRAARRRHRDRPRQPRLRRRRHHRRRTARRPGHHRHRQPSHRRHRADEHTAVYAATAADVTHVVVDGRPHTLDPEDVGRELDEEIGRLLR